MSFVSKKKKRALVKRIKSFSWALSRLKPNSSLACAASALLREQHTRSRKAEGNNEHPYLLLREEEKKIEEKKYVRMHVVSSDHNVHGALNK